MARGAPGRNESAEQLDTLRALNQQPAAVLVGWTPRGLRDSDAPRKRDGTYDGPKLVAWLVAREASNGHASGGDDDLFEGGDNSPNLERCRAEKARELKRKNDKEEGLLIETSTVGRVLNEVFKVWRERAKSIEQLYGMEIGNAIREMVEDAVGGTTAGIQKAS